MSARLRLYLHAVAALLRVGLIQALAAMNRLLILLLVVLAGHASAATLDKSGMAGIWTTPEPQGFISSISQLFNEQPRDRLEIKRDLSVKLIRRFGDGKEQVLSAPPAMVSFHEDLMVVTFPLGTGTAKLVLSGWSSKHSKRLFGNLYLYDSNGLFNGIPVSFESTAGS
jgi:hypothetical protein